MESKYQAVPTPEFNYSMIEKTLNEIVLAKPNRLIEIRMFNASKNGASVGFFTDSSKAIDAIKKYGKGNNVCFGLNPRSTDLLHIYEPNTLILGGNGATDADIRTIDKCFIDIDTRRSLKKCSSSEEEIKFSLQAKEICLAELKKMGIKTYFDGFSGNGHHIIFDIGEQNDSSYWNKNTSPLYRLLKHLSGLCSQYADVDTTVFNPSRVVKLYGTPAIKGRSTFERPHRLSYFSLKEIES